MIVSGESPGKSLEIIDHVHLRNLADEEVQLSTSFLFLH